MAAAPRRGLADAEKGEWYQLVTKGACTRRERKRSRTWRESISGGEAPQVMGVDIKVTIGGLEAISVDHEERTTPFKADGDDPDVTVEDQSTAQAGIRCAPRDGDARCDTHSAICGIAVKLEDHLLGDGDDTAMNGMRLRCCRLP